MTDDEEKKILEREITDGEHAQKLLEDPMIQGFLVSMRGHLINQFGRTTASQQEERDEIWRMTQVVDQFEEHLSNYVENGRFARQSWLDIFKKPW